MTREEFTAHRWIGIAGCGLGIAYLNTYGLGIVTVLIACAVVAHFCYVVLSAMKGIRE